jgi:hypothetical protein
MDLDAVGRCSSMIFLLGVVIAFSMIGLIGSLVVDAAREPPEVPWDPWVDLRDPREEPPE